MIWGQSDDFSGFIFFLLSKAVVYVSPRALPGPDFVDKHLLGIQNELDFVLEDLIIQWETSHLFIYELIRSSFYPSKYLASISCARRGASC